MRRDDNRELRGQADYARGFADCLQATGNTLAAMQLNAIVQTLDRAARDTCGQGYPGCYGGPDCKGNHK